MNFNIEKANPVPLYLQLAGEIKRRIKSGELEANERLPGNFELAEDLKISHLTVHKALTLLLKEGLVVRNRGSGTFVSAGIPRTSCAFGFFYLRNAESVMAERVEAMQCYLLSRGCDLSVFPYSWDFFDEYDLLEEIKRRNLKGAIIYPVNTPQCKAALERLKRFGVPFVIFGNFPWHREFGVPMVRGNERQSARTALEYLWGLGHRRIGLVNFFPENEVEEEYAHFYEARGGFENRWIMALNFSGTSQEWRERFPGRQIAAGYLQDNPDITAVLVEHKSACIDIMLRSSAAGRSVPGELSVMGLRDSSVFEMMNLPVTAMHLSSEKFVKKAVDRLIALSSDGDGAGGDITDIDYELVERESVAAPPGLKEASAVLQGRRD